MAFASKLSQERPNDKIVVFEAGSDGREDQRIYIPWMKVSDCLAQGSHGWMLI